MFQLKGKLYYECWELSTLDADMNSKMFWQLKEMMTCNNWESCLFIWDGRKKIPRVVSILSCQSRYSHSNNTNLGKGRVRRRTEKTRQENILKFGWCTKHKNMRISLLPSKLSQIWKARSRSHKNLVQDVMLFNTCRQYVSYRF